jgi:hypothetical protein
MADDNTPDSQQPLPEVQVDVEMSGDVEELQAEEPTSAEPATTDANDALPFADEELSEPLRITFVDYLKSPIVELLVGKGEQQTKLTAHQALLVQSPYFEAACAQFGAGITVS